MKAGSTWTTSFLLALLTCVATPARAEPITAVYDVQILNRFTTVAGVGRTEEPFLQQFALFMTFDPASSTATGGVYGAPFFSPVPLDVPPPPEGFTLTSFGSTTHFALAGGGVVARASAGERGTGNPTINGSSSIYSRSVTLMGSAGATFPPLEVTPQNFPAHLALTPQLFNFFYSACVGIVPFPPTADNCNDAIGPGSQEVLYLGTATLRQVEQGPVPEPATFALVGSSLAILARCRKRIRSRNVAHLSM